MPFPVFQNTDRFPILPDGEHVGLIADCTEEFSKSGNKMWVLSLEFEGGIKARDYLVLNQTFAWKMKALVDALNIPYDGKLEAHDLRGKSVLVLLGHEDATANYAAKNVVQNYLVSEGPLPAREINNPTNDPLIASSGVDNDSLPF